MKQKTQLSAVILVAIARALLKIAHHLDYKVGVDPITPAKPKSSILPETVFNKPLPDMDSPFTSEIDEPQYTTTPPPPPANTTTPPPPPANTTTPPPPTGVDLDSEGLPWDARIHADSKKQLVRGGTWKVKRNIDPTLVETIKTELRNLMALSPITPAISPDIATENVPPFAPPPVNNAVITTLPQLMAAALKAKKTPANVQAACVACGIEGAPLLAARPDIIPAVAKALGV